MPLAGVAASHRADDLVRHSPAFRQRPAQTFRLARQTLGEHESEAVTGAGFQDAAALIVQDFVCIWGRKVV
jgi:hypothetical protein